MAEPADPIDRAQPASPIAFVAGATGYTGREVVRECLARGMQVFAHVRPDSPKLEHWRRHFESVGAELDSTPWELAAVKDRFDSVHPSQVYALLGTTRASSRVSAIADTHESVDYGLSILLLEAAVACGSRPCFVYLSAMGAGGRPVNAYMEVRKRVEAAVRGSGLPFVIARPGLVSGSDRDESRPAERTAARVADGLLGVLAKLGARKLANRYSSITGAGLARALVALASWPNADPHTVAESGELRALADA